MIGNATMTPGNQKDAADSGRNDSGRTRMLVVAAIAALVAGGLIKALGASTLTSVALAVAGFGVTLWITAMQPPATAVLDEAARRQRHRSVAIAVCLAALVVIFYVATIVRLGPNALKRDSFGGSALPTTSPLPDAAACKKAGTC